MDDEESEVDKFDDNPHNTEPESTEPEDSTDPEENVSPVDDPDEPEDACSPELEPKRVPVTDDRTLFPSGISGKATDDAVPTFSSASTSSK